mmetsp:Transcript_33177/g.59386  ORF Transcript_33177/g.59386 Transcript_33177/m.59386 type:complete len:109 (+) Transcript_33177:3828-4154(+)
MQALNVHDPLPTRHPPQAPCPHPLRKKVSTAITVRFETKALNEGCIFESMSFKDEAAGFIKYCGVFHELEISASCTQRADFLLSIECHAHLSNPCKNVFFEFFCVLCL